MFTELGVECCCADSSVVWFVRVLFFLSVLFVGCYCQEWFSIVRIVCGACKKKHFSKPAKRMNYVCI